MVLAHTPLCLLGLKISFLVLLNVIYLLPFPRWADPLESDPIQDAQHWPLVTATICGCGVNSLCPSGPTLQAKCHRGWLHHSLWHCGLAHQTAKCLWRICLNTGNSGLGKVTVPAKDLCRIYASVKKKTEWTLWGEEPLYTRFSGWWIQVSLVLRAVEQMCTSVSSFSGYSSCPAGLG